MEKAIKKAIEGGWGGGLKSDIIIEMLPEECVGFHYPGKFDGIKMAISGIVLQPVFWQAIAKASPVTCWACKGEKYHRDIFTNELMKDRECGNCDMTGMQERDWKQDMRNFIDNIIDGKPIDDFFIHLLK